ncbi:hypothetical protein [Priestia aryabhattai]
MSLKVQDVNELFENLESLRGKPVTFKLEVPTHKGMREVVYKGDLLKGDKVFDDLFATDKVEIATSKMPSNVVFGMSIEHIEEVAFDNNQLVINNVATLSW